MPPPPPPTPPTLSSSSSSSCMHQVVRSNKRYLFLGTVFVIGCCVYYPSFHFPGLLLQQEQASDSSLTRGLLRVGSRRSNVASYEPQAAMVVQQDKEEENHTDKSLVGGVLWQELDAELRANVPDFEALTSTKNVRPFRSPADMARAQACFRQFQGYGYLLHMRKAGGTTLRNYLNDMIIQRPEHLIYVSEGQTFNVSCFRDQGELMAMTALRHPMARILSSFWFEGQFQYKAPPLEPSTNPNVAAALYNETEAEARLPLSFADWVRLVRQHDYLRWERMTARSTWFCVDNYYTQTLINRYRTNTYADINKHQFELAKRVLASFDLVLITEWMGWANQTAYVQYTLGEQVKDPSRGLLHRNKLVRSRDDSAIDREVFRALWRANTWDLLLYEFAQNLVTERMAAFQATQQQLEEEEEEEEEEEKGGKAVAAATNGSTVMTTAVKQKRIRKAEKQEEELQCRPPINDPHWRNWGQDEKKPNVDSYLYIIPQCMDNDYKIADLKVDLW